MAMLFRTTQIGRNPFASRRDVAVVGAIAAGFTLFACTLFPDSPMLVSALAGGLLGCLPSVLMVLPVHGVVSHEGRAGFAHGIAELGFIDKGIGPNGHLFEHRAPSWARWDSNRVVMRERADGDIDATVPLYVHWQINRFAAMA